MLWFSIIKTDGGSAGQGEWKSETRPERARPTLIQPAHRVLPENHDGGCQDVEMETGPQEGRGRPR